MKEKIVVEHVLNQFSREMRTWIIRQQPSDSHEVADLMQSVVLLVKKKPNYEGKSGAYNNQGWGETTKPQSRRDTYHASKSKVTKSKLEKDNRKSNYEASCYQCGRKVILNENALKGTNSTIQVEKCRDN